VFPLVILYEAGIIISMVFAKTSLRNAGDDDDEDALEPARPIAAKSASSKAPAASAAMRSESPDDV